MTCLSALRKRTINRAVKHFVALISLFSLAMLLSALPSVAQVRFVPQPTLTELSPASATFPPNASDTLIVLNWGGRIDIFAIDIRDRLVKTHEVAGSHQTVAFSPDGNRFVSSDGSDRLRVRTIDGLIPSRVLDDHEADIESLSFKPDGTRILSAGTDGVVGLWDVETGTVTTVQLQGYENRATSFAFSPDGSRIAARGRDSTVRVWDVETGRETATLRHGHDGGVRAVAFSPDGTRIVSAASDGSVWLWNVQDSPNTSLRLGDHANTVTSLAFAPDGNRIVGGDDAGYLRLWNAGNGVQVGVPIEGHGDKVLSVSFSPDGARIVSAGRDNEVRLWNANTTTIQPGIVSHQETFVRAVAFTRDPRAAGPNRRQNPQVASVNASGDAWLFSGGHQPPTQLQLNGAPSDVVPAISADGRRIVLGGSDGTVRVWRVDGTQLSESCGGHPGTVRSVAFSRDAARTVSGGSDGSVRVWDAETGVPLGTPLQGHAGFVSAVAFSHDQTGILSGDRAGTLRLWNAEDSTLTWKVRAHEDRIMSAAFSPSGTYIATASIDGTMSLWNAQDGSLLRTLEGHKSSIFDLQFSPDGEQIASIAPDSLRLWSVPDGAAVAVDRGNRSRVQCSVQSRRHSPCLGWLRRPAPLGHSWACLSGKSAAGTGGHLG